MRILKSVLPHLAISLNLALLVAVILDYYNPVMGFLMGPPFRVLFAACFLSSMLSAVLLAAKQRREKIKLTRRTSEDMIDQ